MKYLATLCMIALYAACGGPSEKGKTAIAGKILGAEGQIVTFQNNSVRGTIDSTTVDTNGEFTLSVRNMPLDFYKLKVGSEQIILIMDSTQNIAIEGESSRLKESYSVHGSQDSQHLAEFSKKDAKFRSKRDSLEVWYKGLGLPSLEDKTKYEQASKDLITPFYSYLTDFIDNNPSSPVCITISNNLHPIQEFDRYIKIKEGLKDVIPLSNAYLSLKKKIADAERKKAEQAAAKAASSANGLGNEAPEISLEDPNGEVIPLSSLRGKYVLVDFWASWCGPCRRENPNVVRMYEKYKNDGFEIYGVSLDSSKDRWLGAIAQDRLTWTHVSDLAKWNSVAAKAYGVRSIPHTVLLDKEGKIMDIKLRGAELEAKLQDLFGH